MEAILEIVAGIIGGGAVGAFISGFFTRQKINAEADNIKQDAEKKASEIWENLATKMESRVGKLEQTVDKQEKKITRYGKRIIYLTKGVEILINQLQEIEQEPCWVPDEWNPDDE